MDEQPTSSKKIIWIAAAVIFLLLIIGVFYFMTRGAKNSTTATSTSLFGSLLGGENRPVTGGNTDTTVTPTPTVNTSDQNPGEDPLFKQLSIGPIAGATQVMHDGKVFVRYILRENAHVYEVDPRTGVSTQLTNTTIPRIYEASWGSDGNAVLLRYLAQDPLSKIDIIKTYLAYLNLPIVDASSTQSQGTLVGDFLPDNISALSVSPDGKQLFYLLPIPEGVSGTLVTLATKSAHEVFRNSFSEWLPELLNNGSVILTTKASANIPGYSYLYTPSNKTLTRIVRDKKGLTTHTDPTGAHILFGENVSGNLTLGFYSKAGTQGDEETVHEAPLSLTTLPEKCAWATDMIHVYCGAISGTPPRAQLPDDWYKGTLPFADSFWSTDIETAQINLIGDPQKLINRSFDVTSPFLDGNGQYFFFTNKSDSILWAMQFPKHLQTDNSALLPPDLTPDEMKDAAGSFPQTAPTSTTKTVVPVKK